MKRLLLITISIFLAIQIQSQEVSEDQWTILTKKTADWCPYCGDWGWDFFNEAIESQSDQNIIIWSAHYSGGLSNDISKAIGNNYNVSGQPVFFLDSDDLDVRSNNVNEKLEELDYLVEAITEFDPSEVVGSDIIVDTDEVTVKQKVKFNIDRTIAQGDFSIGTYIVDNELVAYQASQSQNANHKNVILGEISNQAFGEVLPDGNYAQGEEYTIDYTIDSDDWNYGTEGLSIVTVLWTYDNGKYYFINGNIQELQFPITSTIETLSEDKMTLTEVRNNSLRFQIDSDEFIGASEVSLINTSGQLVTNQSKTLNKGEAKLLTFPNLSTGVYIIRVQSGTKSISKRFLLK